MQLEAHIPTHRALPFGCDILEHFHVELAFVVDYRYAGAVDKADSSTLPETCQPQEHGQSHETAWHDLHETAVGECPGKQMLPLNAHAPEIIMLEVAVGVEVEADQYGDDLGIGHHALSAASWSVSGGRKSCFCHLDLKFLAEIIRNTKNFSNFTFGNHDMVFKVWCL